MSHLDDLPKRDGNHVTEEKAVVAFQKRLLESGAFILQSADRKDYGTDCQIEVLNQGSATNVRIHVQLKGTERSLNADASVSVAIARTNLNYLLTQPHSFYVCYHVPTDSLRICFAEAVLRQYEHGGRNWTEQQTLTLSCTDELTVEQLKTVASLAKSSASLLRDRRTGQVTAAPSEIPGMLRRQIADVHVPENREAAAKILESLYKDGADDVISAAFDKFIAVLGTDDNAMNYGYMAEINLGMAGRSSNSGRIEAAIGHFQSKLNVGSYQHGSLHYTIGNAQSALGKESEAKKAYETALEDQEFTAAPELAAKIHKNLGTSIERSGDQELAVSYYYKALHLDPNLPEAHNALGNHYIRIGDYQAALDHFDRVVFTERQLGATSTVAGWRVNALFNLTDGRGAFREIASLLGNADDHPWIWPWCAQQVANFGRATVGNARQAIGFWQRYIAAHPAASAARRELLLATFYLRAQEQDIQQTYAEFRKEFERQIAYIDDEDAALPWDRLGHWAQDEGDWAEAERCFRKAFELEGGHYGYCLGTALNFLAKFDESLPILLEQAEVIQPDAMSWFQAAVAYENLGRPAEAIAAYDQALTLDPNYDLAMFNLGGVHWNSGDHVEAKKVWAGAIKRFPDHELAATLRCMVPSLFPHVPDSN
ncbi:tetratricopeptide repeat protein [Roseicella sp. DB1501]|uniref:tetratricopeptide repeat protein n=1 Tax=Roseicella sp. DB1501 TaxID=2730925 RepID=UPI001490E3EC|nr:tetratricopeptide repeat protein [Roseicella sp. DB1501]NOG73532.1 tetratricopeptide repeat protein [Roseicella sp. DB1501]